MAVDVDHELVVISKRAGEGLDLELATVVEAAAMDGDPDVADPGEAATCRRGADGRWRPATATTRPTAVATRQPSADPVPGEPLSNVLSEDGGRSGVEAIGLCWAGRLRVDHRLPPGPVDPVALAQSSLEPGQPST